MEQKCFHCGLDVPKDIDLPIKFENKVHPSCCLGCQAVAQSIIDAGLGKYYHQRTHEAEKAIIPPKEILDQLKLYDLEDVQQSFVDIQSEHERTALLMLSGITCAACIWLIEQQLLSLPGVTDVDLNYSTQRARVSWNNSQIQLSDILLRVRQIGYEASPYDAMRYEAQAQKERKQALLRLWVAGLSMMQVMMYVVPIYLYGDIDTPFLWLLHWASMILTVPVVIYSAVPFYKGALRDLKNKRVGMDTPIAIAIILSFTASLFALFSQVEKGIFFDSISMFVFLLLFGRYLEQKVRRKAADATERLVKLVPAFCHKLIHYPENLQTEESVVSQLNHHDILLVKAGEVIPVDGIVLSGISEVNESMLTGESLPISKMTDSQVTAGTMNLSSPLIIETHGVGHNTRLGNIVRLLDTALSQKPRIAKLADQYASMFIMALLVFSIIVFVFWSFKNSPEYALWITVSLLVITCPCALSLATPTALAAATGNLASKGILISKGHSLETLAQVNDVIFDKTGTLTEGNLQLLKIDFAQDSDENYLKDIAVSFEKNSEHPIASALLSSINNPSQEISLQQIHNHVGKGLSAILNQQQWRLGKYDFVTQLSHDTNNWIDQNHIGSIVCLGNEEQIQAVFYFSDTIKETSHSAIEDLKQQNIHIHLLSGDNQTAVNKIAMDLQIQKIQAGASPEDKMHYVSLLQNKNHKVLMVGDGINDAPVLAKADVSIAMETAADASQEGSDMVMINKNMRLIPQSIRIAKKTRQIIRENLIWALLYNIIAIPIAASGYASPAIAALGMASSSLLVVLNTLRLLKVQ